MSSQAKFAVGESMVAVSLKDNKAYEAKVLAIREHQGIMKYVIHYVGWNSRHDEKIAIGSEEGRLFKGTLEARVNRPPPPPAAAPAAAPAKPAAPAAAPAAPKAKAAAKPKPASAPAAAKPAAAKPAAVKPAAAPSSAPAAKPVAAAAKPKRSPVKRAAPAAAAAKPAAKPAAKKAAPKAAPKPRAPSTSSAAAAVPGPSSGNYMYAIGEEFVYLRGNEPPLEGKVLNVAEHHGLIKYVVSVKGCANEHIRVGSEEGRMGKGSLADWVKRHPQPKKKPAQSLRTQHAFRIGEIIVCIARDQSVNEAKITTLTEHRGVMHYSVHFKGWHNRHDELIPVNATDGKMFKMTMAEYNAKFGPKATTAPATSSKRAAAEPTSEAETSEAPAPTTSKRSKRN